MQNTLSVREISFHDIDLIADYWSLSAPEFLASMGVDIAKLPSRPDLTEMLQQQLSQPYNEKKSYAIIWLVNGVPSGHSNTNKIIFGEEAYMHLHLWNPGYRRMGFGSELVKMTLPYFFNNLKIRKLFCEPYALNPAPNKTLKKAGFVFMRSYRTIPGSLNFEQEVMRWEMTEERFRNLISV